LEDFRNSLPPHLSSKTVCNILGVLRKLFQDAFSRKDILLVPQLPKITSGETVTKWISEDEQEKILFNCKEPYRTFFLFLMKQGCRPGEARALKWDKVDLKMNRVAISAGMDLGEETIHQRKRDSGAPS
jgi:integrase